MSSSSLTYIDLPPTANERNEHFLKALHSALKQIKKRSHDPDLAEIGEFVDIALVSWRDLDSNWHQVLQSFENQLKEKNDLLEAALQDNDELTQKLEILSKPPLQSQYSELAKQPDESEETRFLRERVLELERSLEILRAAQKVDSEHASFQASPSSAQSSEKSPSPASPPPEQNLTLTQSPSALESLTLDVGLPPDESQGLNQTEPPEPNPLTEQDPPADQNPLPEQSLPSDAPEEPEESAPPSKPSIKSSAEEFLFKTSPRASVQPISPNAEQWTGISLKRGR